MNWKVLGRKSLPPEVVEYSAKVLDYFSFLMVYVMACVSVFTRIYEAISPFVEMVEVGKGERVVKEGEDALDRYDASYGALYIGRGVFCEHISRELKRAYTRKRKPVWLDIGSGGGVLVELMDQHMKLHKFERIILVEEDSTMVALLRDRIKAFGWTHISIVSQSALSTLSLPPIDLITFSHVLGSHDCWLQLWEQAYGLLRLGGTIAILDYDLHDGLDRLGFVGRVASRFVSKKFFRYLKVGNSPAVLTHCCQDVVTIGQHPLLHRVEVFPLVKIPYYTFIGRKEKSFDSSPDLATPAYC